MVISKSQRIHARSLTQSVGCATYKEPVRLRENRIGRLTDFTTHFSFKIKANENWTVDGFSFFIAPNGSNIPNNSAGGHLGLLNATLDNNNAQNEIVTVVFDTFKNVSMI